MLNKTIYNTLCLVDLLVCSYFLNFNLPIEYCIRFFSFCVILIWSIGVGTMIDPTLCRADRMVGQVLGSVGALPDIYIEIEISYYLLRRLLGVRTEGDKKAAKV